MKNRGSLQSRIIQMLMRAGGRFRVLSYPVKFFVVTYLTIYHTIRKIFVEKEYRRLRTGVLASLCAIVLIGAVVVLPALASETDGEATTEIIAEEETDTEEEMEQPEEIEDSMTPEETEIPDTPQPTEIQEEKTEEEEDIGEEAEEEEGEPEESEVPATEVPASSSMAEHTTGEEKESVSSKKRTQKLRKSVAREKLDPPRCEIVKDGTGEHVYPLKESFDIEIKATASAGAGIEYQWYVRERADGEGTMVYGNGAQTKTLTIPEDINAGNYYYYCVVKSVDNDGEKEASDEAASANIVVTITKGEPKLEDFDVSAIKNEYYYTGEYIDPPIESPCNGMGKAYIVVKDGDAENRPKAESKTPYELSLHVSEGKNYMAKTLPLNKSILISRIPTPSHAYRVDGDLGKVVDGKQWYTSDVHIKPKDGYLISTTQKDFVEQLSFSSEGTNIGPEFVYLRDKSSKAITEAVTVTEKRDEQINIDKKKPEASITYDGSNISDNATAEKIEFCLKPSDATSGLAKRYYYLSDEKKILSETELKTVSWTEWLEGDTITAEKDGYVTVYAKVEDKAGNIAYVQTPMLLIDTKAPTIDCDGVQLGDERTYVADMKEIIVKDANLSRVVVKRNDAVMEDKSGDSLAEGHISFSLYGPSDMSEQEKYEVEATDVAGNVKKTTIIIKNPVRDVTTSDIDFGTGEAALVYGYDEITPKEVTVEKKDTGDAVTVDQLKLESGDADAFEIVSDNTVRPKQKLSAGDYNAVLRVYYGGPDRATTTCRCKVSVKKAKMLVRYLGQEVGYHTVPNLTDYIDFASEDFKNGDTLQTLQTSNNFQYPTLVYLDEEGQEQPFTSDIRATKTMKLMPRGGQSENYEFDSQGDGTLEVVRHPLRAGYVIDGDKVENHDWYVSRTVMIRPLDGFAISPSDEVTSFDTAEQQIVVNGPQTTAQKEEFYIMDRSSGEISSKACENIKIDCTAPYFRTGEGMTISSDLLSEFMNAITFGQYFNDTKTVEISATDDESGIESIQYAISGKALQKHELDRELAWKEYEGAFSISPEEYEYAVVYAKITNHAGLSTYISSNGMVFDNKQPDILCVQDGKEQDVVDEQEYITEEFKVKVQDNNLKKATLYDGTNTTVTGSALEIVSDDSGKKAEKTLTAPAKGSKTYTVVASDGAGNNTEREFTVTKPVYGIKAETLKIKPAVYGYNNEPQVAVTWENSPDANARAVITDVTVDNPKQFSVKKTGDTFWIVAQKALPSGDYHTKVSIIYNGKSKAETTCSFTVEKATLTATYQGDDLFYHEKLGNATVKVVGFVKNNGVQETAATASGYKAPEVVRDTVALKTMELTPSGGKADNYRFDYKPGLLLVERRYATSGKVGQYEVTGKISNSGWYLSDIVLKAKEGYALLEDEQDVDPKNKIELTKDVSNGEKEFYVTNVKTGEIYHPSTLYYKKDTKAPVIKGIENGATYDANTKAVTIEDENLVSVTVNGEARKVEQGRAEFELKAEQETMVYVIVAADCAGNVQDSTVVLNQVETIPEIPDEPEETPEPDKTPKPEETMNPQESSSPEETPRPEETVEPEKTETPTTTDDEKPSRQEGTLKKQVKVINGAPNTSITTSKSQLVKSVLTTGERNAVDKGSNANIELCVKNIDSAVPQKDKELIIGSVDGYSIGAYIDITLWKKIGSSAEKKVTNTKKPVSITVSVPGNLRGGQRKFVILRVHNGAVTVLPDLDSVANTITFSTDKFSTYAIAYKKVNTSGSQRTGEKTNGSDTNMYDNLSPEMGDEAPVIPITIVFFTALFGIIGTISIRKRMNQ